ncbi:hypothetical protein H2203_003504 [Taxawa tesnikishii (nom. ined.)]|nr:hypothetical protein H2203_003504 [Dothideales sp. JES 119]
MARLSMSRKRAPLNRTEQRAISSFFGRAPAPAPAPRQPSEDSSITHVDSVDMERAGTAIDHPCEEGLFLHANHASEPPMKRRKFSHVEIHVSARPSGTAHAGSSLLSTEEHEPATPVREMETTVMSNRRPRRAAARISYASAREYSDDDVEPEEELRRPARHVRTARMEDSDYELKDDMDEAAEASVDYEDDDESLGETEEEDHQPSEQFSDNEPHSQRKSKASKGPPSASNSIELKSAGKKTKQRMINLTTRLPGENKEKGINFDLPPLSDVKDIFHDMTEKALKLGLGKVSNHLQSRPLRVATMCSGTEAPLLALEMVNDVMKILSKEAFHLEHLFSAEIDPFKQAYIERNFQPPIIFRDITEITKAKDTTHTATTVYGAQVRIPDNLDLVIAGTSCKDFSGLNAHQKGLADGGESGDTFHAVLKYAELYRPRILILENVFNAPWDAMLEEYERIGYQVGGVLVDTKDFYLPQTRQRGYMVCLDKNHLASDTNAAERWTDLMRKFKRPASSSISAFLQPNDDPSAVQLKTQLAKLSQFDTVSREVDWSKCEIRHIRYRHAKGIGNARPYTNWQESGLLVVPDHADKVWHARQVERVWDMQDCSLLRKAHPNGGGYDVQFKTRVWDLSQNVDRFVDGTPFGITPCLTPTGIFFVTDRGGPLTFQECFKLQGIPLDKITFTTETRAQVQDMAGNAMSSTVVGSAILSALIAGSKILRHDHKLEPESSALAMSASQVTPITDGARSGVVRERPTAPLLRQPIARSMCGTSLLGAQWEWRLPADTLFNLSIQGKGKKVPSWKARLNLPVSRDESMWQQLRIDLSSTERVVDIAGLYEYLPNCGTAGESLYKRISSRGKSMYLFWDPSRIGDPSMDGFVFANDCSRLEYDEIRQVTARLDPAWRPLTLPGKAFTSPQGFVDGHWTTSTGTKLDAVDTNLAVCTSDFITSSLGPIHDCSSASTLISFTIPTTAVVSPLWQQSSQRIGTHDKAFFTAFAWAFEPLNSLLRVPDWQFIDSTACGSGICDQCAPKTPQLRWKLHSGPKDTVRAYEDPASATSYELALKRRPDLFAVECSFRGSGSKNGSIKVGLNVPSMVHRALAKLHRVLEGKGTTPTASVKWKLDTHYVESHPTALPTFTLRGNDPGVSFTEQLKIEVGLWPKQLQSLAWMRAQEAGEGKRTVVEESEETLLPYLGWRAEARAQAPVHVRGGILADHPGFGKTVTSLTLVHSEFQSKSVEDILANMKDAKAHGFIKISATLVVCPKTLVKQWESEVKKVLGPVVHKQTIVISELAQLSRQKIQDFEAARIIVVNQDIFTHPTYVWRLARFAGVPYPSSVNRREFKAWLEFAINQIPAHLEILQQSGVRTLALEIERKFQAHLDDEQFQALVPSKRLTGKDYALKKFKDVNANNQQKNAKKDCTTTKKKASAPKDININLDKCLFEMFHFNRVIVDEFTYLKPKDKASILAIKADKRWALSATAPLRDPYDIAEIASLIGVPLRHDRFGEISILPERPSHAVHSRICETAQEFLNDFVRQNILEFKDHPYIDSIVPVTLGLDHRIVYTELSERLNSQDMRIKKGNKKTASERDREQRVLESLSSATTAEQALLKQAACFSRAQGSGGETSGLVALLHKRESDCAAAEARLKIAIFQSQQMAAASYHNVDPLMMWKKSVVDDDILEDEETALSVASMIGAAERNHPLPESVLQKARKTKKKPSEGEQEDADEDIDGVSAAKEDSKEAGAAMRTQISETNQFAKRYRDAKRALVKDYDLLWAKKMGHVSSAANSEIDYGQKVTDVIELVQEIERKGDQGILFVSHESQIDQVSEAFTTCRIRHTTVKENVKPGQPSNENVIEDFKTDESEERSTVIILNGSNASAAGINLTNANHVIFFSPLLVDSQYVYESNMTQAIGRVRRPGQRKTIFVYRFIALDTIDVDILEHRERRRNALTERGAPAVVPPKTNGRTLVLEKRDADSSRGTMAGSSSCPRAGYCRARTEKVN